MSTGNYRQKLGAYGEKIAADYLVSMGYKLIAQNYRTRQGEIDMIAEDGDELVFIEVKTARDDRYGPPETWVNPRKQRKIFRNALYYVTVHHLNDIDCRFDVIAIIQTAGIPEINHIKNAF
jgi:putative endonuclease